MGMRNLIQGLSRAGVPVTVNVIYNIHCDNGAMISIGGGAVHGTGSRYLETVLPAQLEAPQPRYLLNAGRPAASDQILDNLLENRKSVFYPSDFWD